MCASVDCCWIVSLPLKFPTSEAFRKHLWKDLCGLPDVYVGLSSHQRLCTNSWDFLRAPSLPWPFSLNLTWDAYSCGTYGIMWPTGQQIYYENWLHSSQTQHTQWRNKQANAHTIWSLSWAKHCFACLGSEWDVQSFHLSLNISLALYKLHKIVNSRPRKHPGENGFSCPNLYI